MDDDDDGGGVLVGSVFWHFGIWEGLVKCAQLYFWGGMCFIVGDMSRWLGEVRADEWLFCVNGEEVFVLEKDILALELMSICRVFRFRVFIDLVLGLSVLIPCNFIDRWFMVIVTVYFCCFFFNVRIPPIHPFPTSYFIYTQSSSPSTVHLRFSSSTSIFIFPPFSNLALLPEALTWYIHSHHHHPQLSVFVLLL